MTPLPRVGLPTDHKQIGAHPFLAVGEKYVRAVVDGAGCLPLLVPTLDPVLPLRDVLAGLDGLLLTGAVSNIEPHHYSDESSYEGNLLDPRRDATNLPLIPLAIEMGVPVLAICRGFQEVNVALGGSLHQAVQEVPGLADHRARGEDPAEVQYGPAHPVHLVPGGLIAATLGGADDITVNSVHGQGVNRLAAGLRVEARAPDGLVEAFSIGPAAFQLAVQWHPEWQAAANPVSMALLRAFGAACQDYRDLHRPPSR